jgi:hypothetical protein
MPQTNDRKRLGWIGIGILIGFLVNIFLPVQPLHAVATQGVDGFALATGAVDNSVEGVYFLDTLTGDLKGAVLNLSNGQFATFYQSNILKDFQVDGSKPPKFLMVTGLAALRHGPSQVQPGLSVVYVMEVNSGVLAAYGVPWNGGRPLVTTAQNNPFILLDRKPLRNVAVRPQ